MCLTCVLIPLSLSLPIYIQINKNMYIYIYISLIYALQFVTCAASKLFITKGSCSEYRFSADIMSHVRSEVGASIGGSHRKVNSRSRPQRPHTQFRGLRCISMQLPFGVLVEKGTVGSNAFERENGLGKVASIGIQRRNCSSN